METIHCKVSFENELRRFQLNVSETFQNLEKQIKSLYGLIEGSATALTLKYKDDEEDFIMLESDEELKCAIAHSDGLLRLFVERKSPVTSSVPRQTTTDDVTTGYTCRVCCHHSGYGQSGRGHGYYGGRGRCHRGGRRGCNGGRGQGGEYNKQHKIEKLNSKRDYIASALKDMNVPRAGDEVKMQRLQSKLDRIDRRLQWLNSVPPHTDESNGSTTTSTTTPVAAVGATESWEVKKFKGCKRERKSDKYQHCHQRHNHHLHDDQQRQRCARKKVLTPETLAQMDQLKDGVRDLKTSVCAVKGEIRDKKRQLGGLKEQRTATATATATVTAAATTTTTTTTTPVLSFSSDPKVDVESSQKMEQLKNEIGELNDIKKEHMKAIVQLKSQIFALKYEQ